MAFKFELYFADTETTGLSHLNNEIIELSIYRLSDDSQRTWCIKPAKYDTIQPDALRVNGHKLEDLKHQTAFGKETYKEPNQVIPDIENWMLLDGMAAEDRILIGQNPRFDLEFLQDLWRDQGSMETFPWGNRPFTVDTRELAVFIDLLEGSRSQYYNLGSLIKKYNIKNSKAHTAASDTLATKELFMAQLNHIQSKIK